MSGPSRIFCALTSNGVAAAIHAATNRVAYVAPGASISVAEAIVGAKRKGCNVAVTLDCNDDVARLGYGVVGAIRLLVDSEIVVGQSPGLRTGILIIDDEAWSFSPTPLSVEAERQGSETPNAIRLGAAVAKELLEVIAPHLIMRSQDSLLPQAVEVGGTPLTEGELKETERSVADVPVLDFDLQRQVRVFQPYIQYVELSLEGASLRRQTVALPSSLAPLAGSEIVQKRLRTTYSLISDQSLLDDKHLHDKLNAIRKDFAHSIKSLSGAVMLRGKQGALEIRFGTLESDVEKHKETVKELLKAEIESSLEQLKEALLPLVLQNPPPQLLNGCMRDVPTTEEADRWLQCELERTFPKVETILREIELKKTYKDITYSSLNRPELRDELKKAFSAISWDKPFEEFDTARAAEEKVK